MTDVVSPATVTTVLVVEDDAVLRSLATEVFEMEGYAVQSFDSADAAWAWLEQDPSPPDLLFTDVRMPGRLDGLALAKQVRQRFAQLPILVSSGYTGQQYAEREERALFLPKPWSIDQLLAACSKLGL
ncbi:response regulator [Pseudomonas oryzihabitans]|uniref:DNA-binding NtrC family response regulator n=1 Tax=Pseudomonas oryzihabitans TaxID=47885 RepID=A0AAJ2BRU9_9PSED|nr:response regulator [Pseudomonas psychrotolerans]KTT32960.1 histidine kinase [Pseudomonas psychrotolerans]MDR6235254.1 DNA-binding NtrC family response regulator [Pseudomonas psychrotolerans]MDR6355518.1 DNA-binding NtrC family response regulator [Pseudomonas psychrotolerans]QDD89731.1 response regulator [Pseudomonas psychrotolerans]